MPRKPEWIHRIPIALATLNSSDAVLLDRRDVEQLLAVSPRQALRILSTVGASSVGKNLLIRREDLITALHTLNAGEDLCLERRRLQRLSDTITALARDVKARQIPLRTSLPWWQAMFPSLPRSIRLEAGELHIQFTSPQNLLEQLFALSQAIANDFNTFETLTNRPETNKPPEPPLSV